MMRRLILGMAVMLCSCVEQPMSLPKGEYSIAEISLSNQLLTRSYSATISGLQVVEIRPQVSGFITEVCVAEGAKVRKGQTLFIIDQVPYQAALQTALANVESAKAAVATSKLTVESKQMLFSQNVVSEYELQTAQNSLLVQQAALAQAVAQEVIARNNLSYTVVKSPSNGVIGMITYRVGALVSPTIAAPLVTVSDDSSMRVYFSMTENQILDLMRQNGSSASALEAMPEVELRLSDGTTYTEKGKIDAISGIVNSSTGAVSLRATFPNSSGVLRSGGSGNIVLPYSKDNCIQIPQAATFEIQDKVFVYKVVDGIAKSVPVTIFAVNDGVNYIVEHGLAVGDTIVNAGAGLLREGTPIR